MKLTVAYHEKVEELASAIKEEFLKRRVNRGTAENYADILRFFVELNMGEKEVYETIV